jgi:hypothetical protein
MYLNLKCWNLYRKSQRSDYLYYLRDHSFESRIGVYLSNSYRYFYIEVNALVRQFSLTIIK